MYELYLVAIFLELLNFLVIKIAHADALDLMIHLSVYTGTVAAHKHPEIHDHICRTLFINIVIAILLFHGNRSTFYSPACF